MTEIETPPPRPIKRLALFLDGTWNSVGTNTNVWRLRCLCSDKSADGASQLRYYDEGVNGFSGGGWGKGLSENVKQAYDWLVDNYEDGDQIFIFGFSRGAYTARSLAGLISIYGLLKPGGPLGVNQLYERYMHEDDRTIYKLRGEDHSSCTNEERWILRYSREIPIEVVGVWDTVGAVGIPLFSIQGISSSTLRFHHTGLRQPIKHGFHALAIDEHRPKFAPTIWTVRGQSEKPAPSMRSMQSVEQRWFVGAHANVGGGCYNDTLAQIPLRWMMTKAALSGLTFREEVELDGNEQLAPISDSYKEFLKGFYSTLFNRSFRPIGAAPVRTVNGTHFNVNETIDASVFDRWRRDNGYRPPNLAAWAQRHGVKPEELQASVLALSPDAVAP
ncbi:DUF2235 domain-containing protein [Sphingosinicella rhizophila]|uniref:DUF2235 domain-containing protein n=1 Tax=Sphingosinicella rhizophila TaxID=3050082 RepID=A0ABU3Q3D4_9SPHN|nr:DUF2235 domain-containing protein [Sphingosinicella sp. GR2756]MDT9597915.1 DUF2235 domain-containing protein [Sphingosinicella sp. GR2756]